MTQDRVLLPRPGLDRGGMGRDIAEAVPAAMAVFERGSAASRPRPRAPVLPRRAGGARSTRPSSSRRSSRRRSRCSPRSASAAIEPDFVVGHSVGEFAALAAAEAMTVEEAIALVRERGIAMAEAAAQHPGSMAAILGLEDEVVETLCRQILGVWPANYNCPGQIVVSGENDAVDECIERAQSEGARRAVKLKVSGAFHSPLVARAADRLRPAIEQREVPGADRAVHVDRHRARRVGAADGAAPRRPAHRAGALHAGRDASSMREGVQDVRRGRPGQRALGAREADRPQRQGRSRSTTSRRSTSCTSALAET